MSKKLIIAIDFDGSVVTHEYPEVGKDIGAVPVLKRLVLEGHSLMLWTMRGNKRTGDGIDTLADAVNWFKEKDIPLWGINENPNQTASNWTNSKKQHADLYIDDAALGCPLLQEYTNMRIAGSEETKLMPVGRPFVNWKLVEEGLEKQGVLTEKSKIIEDGK